MGWKRQIFKLVVIVFILYVLANPAMSTNEYNQVSSWACGMSFGVLLCFFVIVEMKGRMKEDGKSRVFNS